ncbi:uncharacterized protein ACA1_395240 [Acanthamoeba castellanii str. Neff]|uniref:Uncharacterized protein n=1 Tax=Acanthamoeba castellanii (strain ATCC 30010 / Neff) TaxID=1257118 RepID=L8H0G9_ACACF|nr:uncharacterized protein ACA1_395240 [Acanthamoeba castellanii str. Neff]ELR18707.1 hypothetical protein ACA1_395240 [Acanthamoeba castellanii str. Neff]
MTRVFFVDFENKCQNFIKKSISKVDTYYQRAEQPAEGSGELFHVHIFYRSDGPPTGLPGNRKWMTHHPIEPTGKNAADYAMIEAVQSYPIAKGDEIYVVCGGDKIYRQTFDPIPESYHIIDDATFRHLSDYMPLPAPLRLFLFFLRWFFVLRLLFFL